MSAENRSTKAWPGAEGYQAHHRYRRAGALVILACLSACASRSPRILEVSAETRTHTIAAHNEAWFVHDRASHIRIEPAPLDGDRQGQQFLVRWTPNTLATVKFEYRQVNKPNVISEQVQEVNGSSRALFHVVGEEHTSGGSVSAWNVTAYDDKRQPVARASSTLWQPRDPVHHP